MTINNPIEGIAILIFAILMIVIIGMFGSALIDSTDNPEAKKQIEETTEIGIDTIVFIVAVSGAIGTVSLIGLIAYLKRNWKDFFRTYLLKLIRWRIISIKYIEI